MNPGKENLGNPQQARVTEASRIPMSAPHQKLAVPDIPGYHLHWHLGKNVPRALQAGYTHVTLDDGVDVANTGIADPKTTVGSTDMGSNISILAGDSDEGMEPERLYLMKLPQEWWEADQRALLQRNESIAQQLRGGMAGAEGDSDRNRRYVKTGKDLFIPKKPI